MKKSVLLFLLLVSGGLFSQISTTYNSCIDSTLISYALNPCSGFEYAPVCGCDNVTYHNECTAYSKGLLSFTQGPCEFMDFNFYPNPVATASQLKLKVICKGITDINVWIFDAFFRQQYYQISRQFSDIELYPDVRGWGNGVFFIVVEANGVVKVKKLLVNQINP